MINIKKNVKKIKKIGKPLSSIPRQFKWISNPTKKTTNKEPKPTFST